MPVRFLQFPDIFGESCLVLTVFIFECLSVLVDPSFQVRGLTKICLVFLGSSLYLAQSLLLLLFACVVFFLDF